MQRMDRLSHAKSRFFRESSCHNQHSSYNQSLYALTVFDVFFMRCRYSISALSGHHSERTSAWKNHTLCFLCGCSLFDNLRSHAVENIREVNLL